MNRDWIDPQQNQTEGIAARRRGWSSSFSGQFATLGELAAGQTAGLIAQARSQLPNAARVEMDPATRANPVSSLPVNITPPSLGKSIGSVVSSLGNMGFSSVNSFTKSLNGFTNNRLSNTLGNNLLGQGISPLGKEYKSPLQMMQEYQEAEAAKRAGQQGNGAGGQSATSPWENVNRWGDTISQAASKYGVPIDILYAIMMLESGGDPNAGSPQGATGLMQIMPFWNGTGGYDINDPNQNIMLGALILKQNFEQHGDWDTAIRAYLGFGVDALGTTDEAYLARVNQYRQQVTVTNTGAFGGGGGSVPPQGFATLWGGGPPPGEINYVFGSPAAGPYYEYASAYGGDPNHHTGVDVPMPVGTPLYSLVSGTIVDSCTGSGFADYFGQGCGRITILTDSGDLIVYGHTSTSTVRSGQRVNPGMQVGTSGGENGPHLHLEVRVGGNHLVDPFAYFGA